MSEILIIFGLSVLFLLLLPVVMPLLELYRKYMEWVWDQLGV